MRSEDGNRNQTVLVAAFDGWNDACQAATNAVRHLVDRYESRVIGHISCDGYYDYQVARPMVCHVEGHRRIVWPETTFYEIDLGSGNRLYAQIAPEPNYRWAAYCRQSLRIAEDCDVDRVVTLGSMFSDCTHTRPLPLSVSADDCDCGDGGHYNGPVGIPTVLNEAAREQGFETTSMWVSVPQYLGSDECAQGTLELVDMLGRLVGVELDRGDLPRKAAQWAAQGAMLVRCNDDLADYVHRLEHDYDLHAASAAPVDSPAGEQLVREAEDFLRGL
ncbi:PAC2 family protein [Bifidobacterium pullorum subsp. saeculare]|uniref:PAC2 family protein n=1 Tax=Bifidobacterium pullorum subsp. saeculare TaxID=78257 RepID=A0A939B801_9BIFI|nr:PAC2 family protein [Bifidobacterium pullorum]MBM6699317.1 PAC2 family protein [Bifidobacterium pullorum subsp. saeculare]